MNVKKILVLLLFLVVIVGIATPVNAKLIGYVTVDSKTTNGNSKLSCNLASDIGFFSANPESANLVSKRQAELNKVNKAVVKVDGFKSLTYVKPVKGWKLYTKGTIVFKKDFTLNGHPKTIKNKNFSIKLYDNNNKLSRNIKGKVT